jgi:CheY-like chemotaxis protein
MPSRDKVSILVVDDNPAKRLAVSTVLESPDHEIVTAE